jgi:hypothetical protein
MQRGDKSVKPFAATAEKERLLDRLQTSATHSARSSMNGQVLNP